MRELVPLIAQTVIARPEEGGVLLFEIDSDEMYFVPHAVHELLRLCDGSRTVEELETIAAERGGSESPEQRRQIESCLADLAARNLIELWT